MKKKKNLIKVAIDSPAAAGAGTQAKLVAKHYNLFHLDTGKIYRYIGKLRLKRQKEFNYSFIKKKIIKLKLSDLKDKSLLSEKVALSASIIAKDKKIRDIVHKFQKFYANNPPSRYAGIVLDGRDIITVQMKDANFKFFITASLIIRAKRRYEEYKKLKKVANYQDILKSLKKRDESDQNRKHGPLKKTRDSVLISTDNRSIKSVFLKIKRIMDKKIN